MRNIFPSCRTSAGLFVVTLGFAGLAGGLARGQELVRMYELIELQADNDAQSRAYAVNDTGQVVGWIQVGELHHSAQWHNRVTTDLHGTVHFDLQHPLFNQDYSEAYHISNGGQVVGTARTSIECPPTFIVTNAFILRPAVLTDLATPYPGDSLANLLTLGNPCATAYDSAAVGISNSNYVVGWADRTDGVTHAFLVTPQDGQFVRDDNLDFVNDLMVDLGTLAASDPVSSACAVNDAGQVTGYSYTMAAGGLGSYHAFLLTPGDADADGMPDQWFSGANSVNNLMMDLGTLGGANSWGRDINNAGDVVGESDLEVSGQHFTHGFYWHDRAMSDMGTLQADRGGGFSAASAVNASGVVVGWAENEQSERRAFIYENGRMTDLNTQLYLLNEDGSKITPTIVLTEARDINDDGVIVGWGTIKGSNGTRTRGFLLNPVLVNPQVLVTEESNQIAGEVVDNGPTNTPDYSTAPDFGPPALPPATDNQDTVGPTPAPAAPALCGAQGLTLVPLTLLGLCWRRRR